MILDEISELVRESNRELDPDGYAFLSRAEASLRILVNYIVKQNQADSTWRDNLAAAVFAAEAFTEISLDEWDRVANFVRGRWRSEKGKLPEPLGPVTLEKYDFDEIRKAMASEDGRGVFWKVDSADQIDYDRFHRTWILSLLLLFEGKSPRETRNVEPLKLAAKRVQNEENGSFYPERVPWVTARVVMALCASGDKAVTSEIVSDACEWLRKPYPEGPCRLGAWDSGTGTWNTALMATAMSIAALVRAGIPRDDPTVSAGVEYLLSYKDLWTTPGREIDGALAMEAFLLVNRNWRDIGNQLSYLLSWANDREPWTDPNLLASDSHDESSKVPFIASSLIGIIKLILDSERPLLIARSKDAVTEVTRRLGKRREVEELIVNSISELHTAMQKLKAERKETLDGFRDSSGGQNIRSALAILETDLEKIDLLTKSARHTVEFEYPNDSPKWKSFLDDLDTLGLKYLRNSWKSIKTRLMNLL